jgi:cysteine desulfuration protein SufE
MELPTGPLPARLEEIIDAFAWAEGQEKLQLLLDFSNRLPDLPAWLVGHREAMEPVPECMTPVFLYAEEKEGVLWLHIDVPRESPTVRGFAAVLQAGLSGNSPADILAVPQDFYEAMGLVEVISAQRMNGLQAMLAHVRRLARQHA